MSNDFDFDNFGDDSLDFGNDSGDFGFGSSEQDNTIPDDSFDNMFDSGNSSNNINEFEDTVNNTADVKVTRKKAMIAIVIGIVGFILFIIIAVSLKNNDKSESIDKVQTAPVNKGGGGDASSVVTQQKPQSTTANNTKPQSTSVLPDVDGWTVINNEQNIIKGEYTLLTFTATDIKHFAKQVDASGTLITKSVLTGSLSGLPGTYFIEIPYDQGVQIETRPDLGIPCTFEVNVRIDSYNGTRVIGDISTYID